METAHLTWNRKALRWVLNTPGHSYYSALNHSLSHLLDDSFIPLLSPKTSKSFLPQPYPWLVNSCLTRKQKQSAKSFQLVPTHPNGVSLCPIYHFISLTIEKCFPHLRLTHPFEPQIPFFSSLLKHCAPAVLLPLCHV